MKTDVERVAGFLPSVLLRQRGRRSLVCHAERGAVADFWPMVCAPMTDDRRASVRGLTRSKRPSRPADHPARGAESCVREGTRRQERR